MSCSPVPSLQSTNSISFFFHPFHETDNWGFAHAAMQMLLAREATLRIERHKRKWYGGITDRIIYDMIAAELWSKSIEFTKEDDDEARLGNHGIVYPQASYWSVRSVLGKVLAPLSSASGSRVKCLGGYVGPCLPPSPALPESTFGLPVELKARPPMFVGKEEPGLDPDDAMARTIVSGAESKQANAVDWVEPVPPRPSTNPVELQTLRLAKASPATEISAGTAMVGVQKNAPYTARLDFRLPRSKTMVTMTLRSNSLFVAAPPCRGSTHRIDPREADKYVFRVLEVEDLPLAELDARTMGDAAVAVINATSGGAAHTRQAVGQFQSATMESCLC
ncbi:hypothetical protein EDB80DRAFT_768209 [Ilyonectria destructans]|nr:hypothetical protein EDB80DRAFT_768209 [Ilyonectria destructans]